MKKYLIIALLLYANIGYCNNLVQSKTPEQDYASFILGLKTSKHSNIEKIQQINTYFNTKITYSEDILVWNTSDYWATLFETIKKQSGDCEDYAIAKYFSLKFVGVPTDTMFLSYVKSNPLDGKKPSAHMVLNYYPDKNKPPLVLDNLTNEILTSSERKDLIPIFSFNDDNIIVQKTTHIASFSKWISMKEKMQQELAALNKL